MKLEEITLMLITLLITLFILLFMYQTTEIIDALKFPKIATTATNYIKASQVTIVDSAFDVEEEDNERR